MQAMNPPVSIATVSNRGQTNLPAALRHRWGIDHGGEVAFVDLGDAALILPGGLDAARLELRRVLLDGAYEAGLRSIADPDLADQ
jgi:bifunctional DNA-binding transcriptional regulator/antitoxin component of YhaV-PrlF toxin-antitoxin module